MCLCVCVCVCAGMESNGGGTVSCAGCCRQVVNNPTPARHARQKATPTPHLRDVQPPLPSAICRHPPPVSTAPALTSPEQHAKSNPDHDWPSPGTPSLSFPNSSACCFPTPHTIAPHPPISITLPCALSPTSGMSSPSSPMQVATSRLITPALNGQGCHHEHGVLDKLHAPRFS